jgi:hypothetical protein
MSRLAELLPIHRSGQAIEIKRVMASGWRAGRKKRESISWGMSTEVIENTYRKNVSFGRCAEVDEK